jgi:hypothetical protein
MICITIRCSPKALDSAHCGGIQGRSVTDIARKLVSAGEPDGPWEAAWEGRPVSLRGPSVHALAAIVATETDAGAKWAPWVPYPGAEVAPALARVLDARKMARAVDRARAISARKAWGDAVAPGSPVEGSHPTSGQW